MKCIQIHTLKRWGSCVRMYGRMQATENQNCARPLEGGVAGTKAHEGAWNIRDTRHEDSWREEGVLGGSQETAS